MARAPDAGAGEEIEEQVLVELRRLDDDGVLARRQIFEHPKQHPDPRERIADGIWYGALLIAMRALTPIPGFGFCRGHDDFDPQHPEGPVDRLRADIGMLIHLVDVELFGIAPGGAFSPTPSGE